MIQIPPILTIEGLSLSASVRGRTTFPVTDANVRVGAGEIVGLIGESGSGKTLTALSVPRLLPSNVTITGGKIHVNGQDMLILNEGELVKRRGLEIGIVFQDSLSSLNPTQTVGNQIAEVLKLHEQLSKSQVRSRTVEIMGEVGLPQPRERIDAYPHQLSGGMRQRIAIAIAIACSPKLVIADEPTTALDVTTQAQILALLRQIADQRNIGILLITHNLGAIASVADHITVMYGGRTVEISNVFDAFEHPYHPYTQALVSSAPTLSADSRNTVGIPGSPPDPSRPEPGCPFAPRCSFVEADCLVTPPKLLADENDRAYACLHPHRYLGVEIG